VGHSRRVFIQTLHVQPDLVWCHARTIESGYQLGRDLSLECLAEEEKEGREEVPGRHVEWLLRVGDASGYMVYMSVYTIRSSRLGFILYVLAHALAMAGLWLADLSSAIQAGLSVALLVHGYLAWPGTDIADLRTSDAGMEIRMGTEGHDWQEAMLRPETVVLPPLIVLHLVASDGSRRNVTLFGDSLEAMSHRRLRVWLRARGLRKAAAGSGQQL